MSVLLSAEALTRRRHAVEGPLRPLADSLARDVDGVLARPLFIPSEKARLTRRGGRCETDGTLLEFDPFSPRLHRCASCGRTFDDDSHYRWWVMGYQLWLAERAVHAAALFALRGDGRHQRFALAVLEGYADRYLDYPNRDNVLGPTRLFFSTYLESIWLLQIVAAVDLLEHVGDAAHSSTLARVRDRVIEPSAALIAGYDEGMSNRQVWNNAALLAARRALGGSMGIAALDGPSGLVAHLSRALLSDGTWYEGENYHLFAHRGLWYGEAIATAAGVELAPRLVARFEEAFATPFVTALPDFTFPSRRDSQYKVSLRQWRFAELAELGLVRQPDDERLRSALATMYDGTPARGDTGRWRSTAEAERNVPAAALDRTDLGWRSLLFARSELPELANAVARSALLPDQGYAILRRDAGRLYVALDYGHSGAGHGHPDRLNLTLMDGDLRWLDDVGTGSYVDPSLHWYRSTLAHNAPLVDGRSQQRADGRLVAYEDRGGAGWIRAAATGLASGVSFERSVVAMPDYVVDELTWRADRDVTVDLPLHVDGDAAGVGPWAPVDLAGGSDSEDGFGHLRDVEAAAPVDGVRLDARRDGRSAAAWVFADGAPAIWRARSLGPPGESARRFHAVRATGRRGTVATVWDVRSAVASATRVDGVVTVTLANGEVHEHRSDAGAWHVTLVAGGASSSIDLADDGRGVLGRDATPEESATRQAERSDGPVFIVPRIPGSSRVSAAESERSLRFDLGEPHYRRSEPSWTEAGAPTAIVSVAATRDRLVLSVAVRKRDRCFAPRCDENPLDNEHPDTNSDGVQLSVAPLASRDVVDRGGGNSLRWILVPEADPPRVRATRRDGGATPVDLDASWAPTEVGYRLDASIPSSALPVDASGRFGLDLIVNDMAPSRERRRGQLVLGGSRGEFVYLRGDRHVADAHLTFQLADD